MQWTRALPLVTALLGGCTASIPVVPLDAAITEKVTTIPEAFRGATRIGIGATSQVSVFPGRVPQVSLNGQKLLVVPAVVDVSRSHTVVIKSYVTQASDGSYVLFYPLLSLLDDNFQIQQTLKPKYEFAFQGTRLLNEFEVPKGAERLLIHTDQQFFRGSFVGTASTGSSSNSVPAYGVYGALGGAIPGAIGAVAAVAQHAASTGETKEFRLGELGVIEIEAR